MPFLIALTFIKPIRKDIFITFEILYKDMKESIVIIPTYNEKENIENMIHKVFSLPSNFHLLVVDDGSPDGTAAIVKNLQATYPGQLHIEERAGKMGLGTAYIHGFKWCLAQGYEYICEMDADFSHNPDDLERLLEACKTGADLSIGSRYVKGGGVANWDWKRVLLSYCASFYVRFILWFNVKDTTAGFMCYKRSVLEAIDFEKVNFKGYGFQIAMKFGAHQLGFKIKEVPIQFIDRVLGESKMSMNIFQEALLGVLKMKFRKYGKKVNS